LIATPAPGDTNDILARLATLVGVEGGFDTYVLGTGLPPSSVSRAAEDLGASWVLLCGGPGDNAPGLTPYVEQILAGTERSRARVVLLGETLSQVQGLPEDVLTVRDMREMESLLAPVALRMAR